MMFIPSTPSAMRPMALFTPGRRKVAAILATAGLGLLTAFSGPAVGGNLGSAYSYDPDESAHMADSVAAQMSDTDRQAILSLINQARATRRTCGSRSYAPAPAVKLNTMLNQAAQRHSDDMAYNGIFSHTGTDGSSPASRVSAAGYRWSYVAENIAAGYSSAQRVISGWLKSPGHCANIMSARARDIGVGRASSSSSRYGVYWTLNLATPSSR